MSDADDQPAVGRRLARLPNALTTLRVGLAVAFVVALSLVDASRGMDARARTIVAVALGLFIAGAISDALDGYLARRWRVVSVFGRIMDPFADKALVLGAFVMLSGPQFSMDLDPQTRLQLSGISPWMVVAILARDLLITSLRGLLEGRGVSFAALPAGKIKMIVQSLTIPVILLTLSVAPTPHEGTARVVILACAWGAVLVTAWSAIPYTIEGIRRLRAAPEQP